MTVYILYIICLPYTVHPMRPADSDPATCAQPRDNNPLNLRHSVPAMRSSDQAITIETAAQPVVIATCGQVVTIATNKQPLTNLGVANPGQPPGKAILGPGQPPGIVTRGQPPGIVTRGQPPGIHVATRGQPPGEITLEPGPRTNSGQRVVRAAASPSNVASKPVAAVPSEGDRWPNKTTKDPVVKAPMIRDTAIRDPVIGDDACFNFFSMRSYVKPVVSARPRARQAGAASATSTALTGTGEVFVYIITQICFHLQHKGSV